MIKAQNWEEAIKIYSEHHKDIDFVILDIIMPEMGGPDVFDELKK